MENILSILNSKNPEDVTDKELDAFRLKIEEAIHRVYKLQSKYREFTGKNYVPPIRLG